MNSGKLKIETIEPESIDDLSTLSWFRDVSSTIGTLDITNNGKTVSMTGNTRNPGKNAIWTMPGVDQNQKFNFDYDMNFVDSFNGAGMLLRIQRVSNYLEGYMLSFNHGTFYKYSGNNTVSLWKFKYNIGANNTELIFGESGDLQFIDNLSISQTGNLTVEVTDVDITISGGGLSTAYVYDMPADARFGSGYGFFSDHYEHNCPNAGSFSLNNINLEVETPESILDILNTPNWRPGSIRILINVEDIDNEDLSDPAIFSLILSKLMNENVHFIGWGTSENQSQIEKIVEANDSNGTYIANSSDGAIQATVDYLKSLLQKEQTNVVIAKEDVLVKLSDEGLETTTPDFPNGVWKVVHDYKYYENEQGQYEKSGEYAEDLIQKFDYVGKYSIYYKDRLVNDVYAHRRPVPQFNMTLIGQTLNVQSSSYDLDIEKSADNYAEQVSNHGIAVEKWEYQKQGETSWTPISSSGIRGTNSVTLDADSAYIVRLTVTDYQGVSEKLSKTIRVTSDENVKPVAEFRVIENPITEREILQVVDDSYDPKGKPLTYEWKVKRVEGSTKTEIYSGATPLTDYSSQGIGKYEIELVVSNGTLTSDPFIREIEVIEDTTPPAIIITPETARDNSIDITVEIVDAQTNLEEYKYAFALDGDTPTYTTTAITTGKIYSEVLNISSENIPDTWYSKPIYLHVIAKNEIGIVSDEVVGGPYYIEPTYEINVQAVDRVTKAPLQNSKYDITGKYPDGTTIEFGKDLVTDVNGTITIPKAKLYKVQKIIIKNKAATTGYKLAPDKNVSITTIGTSVTIDLANSSSDVTVNTANDNKTINIQVPLDKLAIQFRNIHAKTKAGIEGGEIGLFDDAGNSITGLDGQPVKGSTDVNGYVTLTNIAEGTYKYKQTKARLGYIINETVYTVKIDKYGNVTYIDGNQGVIENEKVKTDITITKVWEDDNDKANKRPNSVILKIMTNGTEVARKEVTEASGWKHTFSVDKYDDVSNLMTYTAEEAETNTNDLYFYTSQVNEYTITNTFNVPDDRINLTVTKEWKDIPSQQDKRPSSLNVQLKIRRK